MGNVNSLVNVKILNGGVLGIEVTLPDSPPLVTIRGRRGFVMCGYLNINVAEKLGLIAVRVVGVKNVEEMLDKEVAEVTSRARELGIREGMKVKDILKLL